MANDRNPQEIMALELAKRFSPEGIALSLENVLENGGTADFEYFLESEVIAAQEPSFSAIASAMGLPAFISNPDTRLGLYNQFSDELFEVIPAEDIVAALYDHRVTKAGGNTNFYKDGVLKNDRVMKGLYERAGSYGSIDIMRAIDALVAQDKLEEPSYDYAFRGALFNEQYEAVSYLLSVNPELETTYLNHEDGILLRQGADTLLTYEQIRNGIEKAKSEFPFDSLAVEPDGKPLTDQQRTELMLGIEASLIQLDAKRVSMDAYLTGAELLAARELLGLGTGEEASLSDIANGLSAKVLEMQVAPIRQ